MTENIILSIDGHNYDQWKTQICRKAATYGNNAYKHGLLRMLITEDEWNKELPEVEQPSYPKRPDNIPENASQLYIQRAKFEQDRFEVYSKLVDDFHVELIKSINDKLYQNIFGNDKYVNEDIQEIMRRLEERFNVPNSESVIERMLKLRNDLHKEKDDNTTFQEYISDIKRFRTNLSKHAENYTDQYILDIIKKSTLQDEIIQQGIKNFKINSTVRTVEKFEEFMEKYHIIYKKTTEDAGYSEALSATTIKDKSEMQTKDKTTKYPNI